MENHQEYIRRRSIHNRLLARQDNPTGGDVLNPPISTPTNSPTVTPSPPAPPPPPPSPPPSSTSSSVDRVPPTSTPPPNNVPPTTTRSTSSSTSPRTTTPSTTPSAASPPTSTSSSVSSSSSSSSESSSLSTTTASSTTATGVTTTGPLPTLGNNRQISSFSTLPRTTFVNSATLSSPSSTSSAEASSALNTGALVGGIAGGLVGLGILVLVSMFLLRRLRKRSYEEDQFDPVTFRRSAVLLDEPSANQSKNGGYETFDPRPPSMLERKLNAHPVAPSPIPQGGYNYDQYNYGGQQAQGYGTGYNQYYSTQGSDNGHQGYMGHPYAQDPHSGHQVYATQVPTTNPYTSNSAVPAARATTRTGAPRDSRVISKVDDEDVYGGI